MLFELPKLKYDYNALEPHIDAQTMEIHYSKHHAAYVTNLNKALESILQTHIQLADKSLEWLLQNLNELPETIKTAVRNNGGGHYNHTLFWDILSPVSNLQPVGKLADSINKAFGSFEKFKEEFARQALGRFGSGWVWLISEGGKIVITSTPNQDNPLMEGKKVVMGLDVWEHAYYLKYQSKRADYVNAWWNVLDWARVDKLYEKNL